MNPYYADVTRREVLMTSTHTNHADNEGYSLNEVAALADSDAMRRAERAELKLTKITSILLGTDDNKVGRCDHEQHAYHPEYGSRVGYDARQGAWDFCDGPLNESAHEPTRCTDLRCDTCLLIVRTAERDELRTQVERMSDGIANLHFERDEACASIQRERVSEKARADQAEATLDRVRAEAQRLTEISYQDVVGQQDRATGRMFLAILDTPEAPL